MPIGVFLVRENDMSKMQNLASRYFSENRNKIAMDSVMSVINMVK